MSTLPRPHITLTTLLFAASLGFVAGVPSLQAQQQVDVRFERGATSTTINGTIVGDEYIDYVLGAQAGQTMVVSLGVTATNGNGSAFFNVLPAGQDFPAIYNGSMDDDGRAEVTFPESGEWAIRVYLMGNDRDAGKTVGYSIDVYIAPGEADSRPTASTAEEPDGPAGLALFGQGFPNAGDPCRRAGESSLTNRYLDDAADLVACPPSTDAGLFAYTYNATELERVDGWILFSVPRR